MSNAKQTIETGKAVLGIEFGSTRIKAVLVNETGEPIASGAHDWENRLEDGIWTYSLGYTTKAAWEMTDMFHLKAIEIISRSLRDAVDNKKEGREGMALGQYIAGMGFSNVGLGIAHSMAHTLGAVYDTPHGVACAMMLPIVMEYNADCTGEKYREIARAMGVKGVDDMSVEEYRKAAVDAVQKLSVDVGIPTKLEALKEEDLDFLAESAHADACAPGNPKDASVEDLKNLFRKLM